ncbi:MAG: CPBP family intramembrane metalloprotease [Oscillospiraceae bacterium]|nr:CPBP family intramembrane metalloprotease [Oscillospiraceae bacterium]
MKFTPNLTRNEMRRGWFALFASLIVLPLVLQGVNSLLPVPLSNGKLNFIFYFQNYILVLVVFHRFLKQSMLTALTRPFATIWCAAVGYLGQRAMGELLTVLLFFAWPGFVNFNDAGIIAMLGEDFALMAAGTVLLVPLAEECLYRGLLFRGLYDRSPVAAWLVSICAFAAIHVIGYIGTASPMQLLLCFIQYLPAGLFLCYCYQRSGTILSPILMHTIVNAIGVYTAMR